MFFCKKQINKYFNIMIKKNLIKVLILLFFVSACGYTPIYTSKNSNFAITQLSTTGNNKLNRIISEKLANYKDANASNQLTLTINTLLNKEVSRIYYNFFFFFACKIKIVGVSILTFK